MALFQPPMRSDIADPLSLHVLGEATPPMTPGTYMRLRRQYAGLSIETLARAIAVNADISSQLTEMLKQAEEDSIPIGSPGSARIQKIIGFDAEIYDRLVAIRFGHNLPIPQICKSCGCSWNDPCIDAETGPCSWSDHDSNQCTCCAHPPTAPQPSRETADAA